MIQILSIAVVVLMVVSSVATELKDIRKNHLWPFDGEKKRRLNGPMY